MNKQKVLELANYIEASNTFGMEVYFHDCGTPSCLAGHGGRLFNIPDDGTERHLSLEEAVASELGFVCGMGDLFRPYTDNFYFRADPEDGDYITKEHAVATLRHLAETGAVDYEKCAP